MFHDEPGLSPRAAALSRADRVAEQAARVERELAANGETIIARGRPRPVVCMDPKTRQTCEYASVSEAAKARGVKKADNICQAIQRKGLCEGLRWAYVGEEPKDFPKAEGKIPTGAVVRGCWPRYRRLDR